VTDADRLARSAALLGGEAMRRLAASRVLVVGVGGVGSWCAEALLRTGVGHVVLVDDDRVVPSNLNRQCPATALTLGDEKVVAMRERLLAIAPEADVVAVARRFGADSTPDDFRLGGAPFDAVVDAIDSVDCKAQLILSATEAGLPLVSSMGAALRYDPTCVTVSRFEKVEGDGLARALRQRFKRLGRFPSHRFSCVWSTEPPVRLEEDVRERGSLMQITATFGMCLAAETVRLVTVR